MVSAADAERRLAAAGWLQRPETQKILRVLDAPAGRTRVVGGIVRDTILGRERDTSDIDLATELVPQVVIARVEAKGLSAYPTGIEHGTVTVKSGNQLAEVTTLRQDVETDGRHAVVEFGTDWRRDAERRDFTLNALYCGHDGALFDPLGGLDDCLAGRVRFIGEPARRIAEDRLRVLRFFRFSASHGLQKLDPAGLEACAAAAGDLSVLSAERVGSEMLRMLSLPRVAQTIAAMHRTGVLDAVAGPGIGEGDLLELVGLLETLEPFPSATQRLALIVHVGAANLKERWRLSNAQAESVRAVLSAARWLRDGLVARACFHHPLLAAESVAVAGALMGWSADTVEALKTNIHAIRVPAFPLTGADLLAAGYRPDPSFGAELQRLQFLWADSGFAMDRAGLLAQIEEPPSRA